MLILTRKPGQIITITHAADLDPATPVGELFIDGPMEICINRITGQQVRVGITAHPGFIILREELYESGEHRMASVRDAGPR